MMSTIRFIRLTNTTIPQKLITRPFPHEMRKAKQTIPLGAVLLGQDSALSQHAVEASGEARAVERWMRETGGGGGAFHESGGEPGATKTSRR